jgi:polysaccharide export outer membrane protein
MRIDMLIRRGRQALSGVCQKLVSVIAVLSLAGCALEPGMHWRDERASGASSASFQAPGSSADSSGPAGAPTDETTAPAGALVEITPAFVERQQAEQPRRIPADVEQLFGKPVPYLIGPGDVLNILVWDHPELTLPSISVTTVGTDFYGANPVSPGYTVDQNGMVQFAYVGAVKVSGLSELEARNVISAKLARFVRNPQITLRIQAYRSQRVYMDGEVRNPGLFVFNDVPMTLVEAINRAGGLTTLGDRASVDVIREGKSTMVSIPDLVEQGINPSDILLKNGDIVRVLAREDSKVFVLGEVSRPTTLFLRNGRLTLNEALGDAGGLNPVTAEGSQVFVVRKAQHGKPEVYHLDASSPTALAVAEGFELKAKDVVFVDAAPVVRWSRVVNLLVPAAEASYFSKSASNP